MRNFLRVMIETTKTLFTGWTVLFWFALYAFGGGFYLYLISLNLPLAIFIGLLFAFPFFYSINVLNEQRKKRLHELHSISKYVQTLVFYLKTGKNILHSFEATKMMVDELLHPDIQKTIDTLKYKGMLDITHFEKYNLKVLDLFHTNLMIKATKGGIATEIFKNTTKDINMELSKRDELDRQKQYVVTETYMMLGMVMAIPIILSVSAEIIYVPFTQSSAAAPFLVIYFTCIYLVVYYMNKRRIDIEVTI